MTETTSPAPWARYREHAATHAFRRPNQSSPYYMRTITPLNSREWARQLLAADPVHHAIISEPSANNPMQSAPFVLFAAYDTRNRYGWGAHRSLTKTHPYAISTYAEGDLTTEFYATPEALERALFLLERAL